MILNICELPGQNYFLNFCNFYHSTFVAFDPGFRLEAGSRLSNLITYLLAFFIVIAYFFRDSTKGCLSLFNYFINMSPTLMCAFFVEKHVFEGKTTFIPEIGPAQCCLCPTWGYPHHAGGCPRS